MSFIGVSLSAVVDRDQPQVPMETLFLYCGDHAAMAEQRQARGHALGDAVDYKSTARIFRKTE